MSNLGNFNSNEHKVEKFTPIPKGDYPMVAIGSEKLKSDGGVFTYIKMQFQIVSGQFQNRRIFANFNLETTRTDDKAATALKIGKGQLSELCRAVGVLTPSDSSQLHNIPFLGHVIIKIDKSGKYDDKNEIRDFKPLNGGGGPAPSAPNPQPPVPTGAPGKPMGW
jgi:hypothetical protein